mgnify:CR=1 FL=1
MGLANWIFHNLVSMATGHVFKAISQVTSLICPLSKITLLVSDYQENQIPWLLHCYTH